eukprot:gene4246-5229_t
MHIDSEEEGVTSPREPPHYTLCFGSSGWLFTYYFGVIKCFKQYGIDRNFHCIGCSGGALACAAGLCTDNEVDDVKDYILACADEARASFKGPFKLRKYILGAVDLFCSGADDYKKVNGKDFQCGWTVWVSESTGLFLICSFCKTVSDQASNSQLLPLCQLPFSLQSLGEYVTEQLPTLKEHAPILEHIVESLPTMPTIIPDLHLNDHFAKLTENLPTLLFNEAGSDSSCLPACMSGFMEMDPSGPLRLMVLLLRQILVSLAAILVYTELVLLTLGWGWLTYMSLWLPGHSKKRQSFWKSFTTYFFCTVSPRLAIRTVPVVGRALALDSHAKKKLEDTSFMYRFLSFLIE